MEQSSGVDNRKGTCSHGIPSASALSPVLQLLQNQVRDVSRPPRTATHGHAGLLQIPPGQGFGEDVVENWRALRASGRGDLCILLHTPNRLMDGRGSGIGFSPRGRQWPAHTRWEHSVSISDVPRTVGRRYWSMRMALRRVSGGGKLAKRPLAP